VADNVAFPRRTRRLTKRRARASILDLLEELDLGALARERIDRLSGGQLARVALARSLAADPELLLLDEPAAALDEAATADLRHLLARVECGLLVVTHDPVEAMLIGSRTAVVEDGSISRVATPDQIAAAPPSGWIARFLGRNLLTGVAHGSTVTLEGGGRVVIAQRHHGPVHVSFAASAVTLHREEPEGSARNVWEVRVTRIDATDDRVRVAFTGVITATAVITEQACADLGLRPGERLWASVKATELNVIPA
jgi:molybdate transport system ATP-binding protein